MDAAELVRILTTFADRPADVDLSKGQLLVQVGDNVIDAKVRLRDGIIYVTEGAHEVPAPTWIFRRIARLDMLADRILEYVAPESNFVTPSGVLLDQLEVDPEENQVEKADSISAITEVLDRRPVGTCAVLYLTSDAGEGKTTLINEIARRQAESYKAKSSDWLLLPISLGGRPFLRFDEVVVGTLLNRFRFPHLYIESFAELVRLGAVVPALDGFEEMFIESSSGDAVSALGNLVRTFKSHGSVLIAARKAYFEYRSLESQARLFDALEGSSVSFARFSLDRWTKKQFFQYAERRGLKASAAIYDDVASSLGADHPLLTRAVLVRRLLDVAAFSARREAFLDRLRGKPENFFAEFVETIIEREAHEKWIDRSGTPAQPLLTSEQHHELLARVAQEMRTLSVTSLSSDVLDLVAELFCDQHKLSASTSRQVVDRIKQHALLIRDHSAKLHFTFDHEEFFFFFLGEALAETLLRGSSSDIRQMFSPSPVSQFTVDVAASFIVQHLGGNQQSLRDLVRRVNDACRLEGAASFSRENAGRVLSQVINLADVDDVELAELVFPAESLRSRRFRRVLFRSSHFQPTSLADSRFEDCRFIGCTFDRIDIPSSDRLQVRGTVVSQFRIGSVLLEETDLMLYDPEDIQAQLTEAGFLFEIPQQVLTL